MPETVSSETHFRGRIVTVRTDEVRLDDGHVTRQEVVEHAQSVTVVPVQADGRVLMIRQYRHPTGETILETVAGSMDPGESPEDAAQRELAEEIGFRAGRLTRLGGFYLAPGWATEFMHAFIALDLEPAEAEHDEDERIELLAVSLPDLRRQLQAGEIRDCKSIAALALAEQHLKEQG
jgi:8-oxo-dGTP pyrophosphatase MutT (NUDIX family)